MSRSLLPVLDIYISNSWYMILFLIVNIGIVLFHIFRYTKVQLMVPRQLWLHYEDRVTAKWLEDIFEFFLKNITQWKWWEWNCMDVWLKMIFPIKVIFVIQLISCTLFMSFVLHVCHKGILCTSWCMSQRRLLYVMNVSKASFVCYVCLKGIFCTSCCSS